MTGLLRKGDVGFCRLCCLVDLAGRRPTRALSSWASFHLLSHMLNTARVE